jgi:ketosteroid isomerase-like protein
MTDTSTAHAKDIADLTAKTKFKLNAAAAQDIDAIMSCYWHSPEFVLYDPCPGQYVGWDTLKTIFLDYHKTWPAMQGSMEHLHVDASGDLGHTFSIQTWKFKKPDGEVETIVHRVTEIWRRIDGEWKCVHEHASVPVDLLGDNRTASNEP